jgi:hypothetical protein
LSKIYLCAQKEKKKKKKQKKIIYKSRFSWMNFARTHIHTRKEENKCLLGMSNSTADREEEEE